MRSLISFTILSAIVARQPSSARLLKNCFALPTDLRVISGSE